MRTANKISFKLEKDSIILMLCMLFFMILNVAIVLISNPDDAPNQLVISIYSAVFAVAGYLMSEKFLYKGAFPAFLIVLLVLIIQLTVGDDVLKRWLPIGTFYIKTSAMLPLLSIVAAKMITLYKNYNMSRVIVIGLPIMICFFLVCAQNNIVPFFMGLLVMYAVLKKMNFENRINGRWFFGMLYVCVIVFLIIFISQYSEIMQLLPERIKVIFTRGKNDPIQYGWTRIFLDGILKDTPLFGATKYDANFVDTTVYEYLYEMGDHKIVIILAKLGWVPFLLFVLAYICFLSMLIEMVRKTNQSSFARYTSFTLVTILSVKMVLCLIGVFLLDYSHNEIPFLSGGTSRWVEFISFGIILGLYEKRNKTTQTVTLERQWVLSEELHFYIFEFQNDVETLKNIYKKFMSKLGLEEYSKDLEVSNENITFEEKLSDQDSYEEPKRKPKLIKYAFMSYSSDNQKSADKIETILKKNGVFVWRDSKGIRPGDKYAETLIRAIEKCSCFVLLLTEDSQKSQWVAREVERAINYGKPIVTIEIGDFELNKEFEMYVSNTQRQKVHFIIESSKEMERIIRSVKEYVG